MQLFYLVRRQIIGFLLGGTEKQVYFSVSRFHHVGFFSIIEIRNSQEYRQEGTPHCTLWRAWRHRFRVPIIHTRFECFTSTYKSSSELNITTTETRWCYSDGWSWVNIIAEKAFNFCSLRSSKTANIRAWPSLFLWTRFFHFQLT